MQESDNSHDDDDDDDNNDGNDDYSSKENSLMACNRLYILVQVLFLGLLIDWKVYMALLP